jgi:beta-lactamase class A
MPFGKKTPSCVSKKWNRRAAVVASALIAAGVLASCAAVPEASVLPSPSSSGADMTASAGTSSLNPTRPGLPHVGQEAGARGLDATLAGYLATRQGNVSVAVYDAVSGTWYGYRRAVEHDMASVAKVTIMAAAFHAEQEGELSLGPGELALMRRMIEMSDNDSATALWRLLGGPSGVARFTRAAAMADTVLGPHWGLSVTTAADQAALLRLIAFPNRLLDDRSRSAALTLLENVDPSQRWGIPAGVDPGVSVAVKDGWLGKPGAGWIINSIGCVAGEGRRYVIAILSDHDPSYDYGISSLEEASRLVWNTFA